ncbi:transposable element Tcb1 transposase [Trichonephila clavipes]|nr:transposable element Tcb1 transposase [Trichonephila clavipes]
MSSIGGYHPYGLASILTGLESIEHGWDMLDRRIAVRQPHPTCLPELRRALLDKWCNITHDQIDNLIFSLPRRCKACIPSSGNIIRINHQTNHVTLFL